MYLARFPRIGLAALPTPLQPAPRFSAALGGKVNIWLKRDDNTGLAIGGNKARKLEFLFADALNQGCDTVITTGGPQSNHCRMTAAAAARLGLSCHLVLTSRPFDLRQGNLLLDELLGAELHFCPPSEGRDISREMSNLAEELRQAGRHPYLIPLGGSNPLGALGYVAAVRELVAQADELGVEFSALIHASGSGGTQAGLLVGTLLHHLPTQVLGFSVSAKRPVLEDRIRTVATGLLQLLGLETDVEEHLHVSDEFVGDGYGRPTSQSSEALQLLARTEGVIIDPVYTAKAMAGLIDGVRNGRFPEGSNVLFWHTGGSPALFADSIFWEGN
ncbi:MAG: D-cysteine desulfhydrase family protein [Bacillota bacterium]|jgi:L-cysteate sulfo-lyase